MAYSTLQSAQPGTLRATLITVETDVSVGIYNFMIVGLPNKEVDESKDRVAAAIKNSGIPSPKSENRKIVTSLAPAHVRKEGAHFDLPIALSYLKATGYIEFDEKDKIFVGELSLSGDVLPVQGCLSIAILAKEKGITQLYVPEANKGEAALVEGITIYPVKSLKEVIDHLSGEEKITPQPFIETVEIVDAVTDDPFMYIKGQDTAKRALLIAAAGGHNLALFGPPGTGKTMLAKAFASLLPPMTREAMLEVTGIHSYAGILGETLITEPPFRAPHHTASHTSLVGGGQNIKPGEITLAHRGVLFLDEFPEFERKTMEALRQPLEDGEIVVSRAKGTVKYPARVTLVAALNPCPCGYKGSLIKECRCKDFDVERYKCKISGPIVDRIDLWVEVPHIAYEDLLDLQKSDTQKLAEETKRREAGEHMRSAIKKVREKQIDRFGKDLLNAHMKAKDIEKHTNLSQDAEQILVEYAKKFNLSPRSFYRMKKIARTIADLSDSLNVEVPHILEAFQYRPKMTD